MQVAFFIAAFFCLAYIADATSYLVLSTREGFECDGDLKAYARYTLDICMLMSATVDGYKVLSGKYVANVHPETNSIKLRILVYTDDSCADYLDVLTYMDFSTACVNVNAPTAAPTQLLPPTASPSATPTTAPTDGPSTEPTANPSTSPTFVPTLMLTGPTYRPTHSPTMKPTTLLRPTATPTPQPTSTPTFSPTFNIDTSFPDWDDQITTVGVSGDHSYVAEIVMEDKLPDDTGFFTKMTLSTQRCYDTANVYMYHWTSNTNSVLAKCKNKASIMFYASQNSTRITVNLKATVTSGSTGDDDYPLGKDDMRHCFAGTESIQLSDGSSKTLSEVKVGDKILSADRFGNAMYSKVVALPHPDNSMPTPFLKLTGESTRDILVTPAHVIAAEMDCVSRSSPSLFVVSEVLVGMCLYNFDSTMDPVVEIERVVRNGAYTVVPEAEMVIVNGFLASPFAFNHAVNNAYYNIWRSVNSLVPSVGSSRWLQSANEIFGALAVAVWHK